MESSVDLVLVDDDILVRMTWKMAAQQKNKNLLALGSLDELSERLDGLNRSVPIYLDSNLGGGVKGEDFAHQLAEAGFQQIYLATGYRPTDFGSLPSGVKGIVGKEPQV